MSVATVKYGGGDFLIQCQIFDNERVKAFPDRKFNSNTKIWHAPFNAPNAQYIRDNYKFPEEINEEALEMVNQALAEIEVSKTLRFPEDHPFLNPPRPYQMDALNKSYGMREFGYFMEMRTGKTFVDINIAAAYYLKGEINAYLIVLFPGAIKSTWKIQLEEHCPVLYEVHLLQAGQKKQTQAFIDKDTDALKVMVVGIESLSNGAGGDLITDFVQKHKTKFTIDESTCIKNPKQQVSKSKKRTRVKLCWDVGGLAEYRTIMTGTPTTQGVEDLYSQFRFLNWQILGYKSYFTFKNAHCIAGGFQGKKIIGYRDVDKVIRKINPYVYQISTKDAIGIPEEVWEPIYVEQSLVQKRLLKELGDPYDMSTSMGDEELEVETILERMTRYQQIVGGHFPFKEEEGYDTMPIEGPNPKMDALLGFIETIPKDQKVIIWARFVPELEAIAKALPDSILYKGGMSDDEREWAQREFMQDNGPRFWVASQQASARGVELAAASVHIFYSNSFSYDDRKQATMRTNSSKQKSKSILYVDIIMNHKIDKQIVDALRYKQDIAEYVISEIKKGQV